MCVLPDTEKTTIHSLRKPGTKPCKRQTVLGMILLKEANYFKEMRLPNVTYCFCIELNHFTVLHNVILHNVVLHNVILHNVVLRNVVLRNVVYTMQSTHFHRKKTPQYVNQGNSRTLVSLSYRMNLNTTQQTVNKQYVPRYTIYD